LSSLGLDKQKRRRRSSAPEFISSVYRLLKLMKFNCQKSYLFFHNIKV